MYTGGTICVKITPPSRFVFLPAPRSCRLVVGFVYTKDISNSFDLRSRGLHPSSYFKIARVLVLLHGQGFKSPFEENRVSFGLGR